MKNYFTILVAIFFLFITSHSFAQNLIVRGGWIVHPEAGEVIPNPDILIQNGKITAIVTSDRAGGFLFFSLNRMITSCRA